MNQEQLKLLGPLSHLVGVWEGDQGDDIAPSDDRGSENNKYHERMVFEQVGPVQNHEQSLHVLRYSTRITRIGETAPFHEELGYWSWEPATNEVMRCFLIPRGIALIAGGTVDQNAKKFRLQAKNGSTTFGINTGPFLDREFKILSYEFDFEWQGKDSFTYASDTVIQIPGQVKPFHHSDRNAMRRSK